MRGNIYEVKLNSKCKIDDIRRGHELMMLYPLNASGKTNGEK